jgi:alpha-D-xyloside xylohydrolase
MKLRFSIQQQAVWLNTVCLSFLAASCQTKSGAPKETQATSPPPLPVQRIQNGVQLNAAALNVKVQFYADDIVRVVKWAPDGTPAKASLAVIQTNLPDLNIRVEENADTVTLASGKVTVRLSRSDGAIQYLGADTRVILKEQGPAIITPAPIIHDKKAFSVQQSFKLAADEGLYGLGQHQSGYMNYRGRTVKLVQANTEAVTPFLISDAIRMTLLIAFPGLCLWALKFV